MEVHNCKSVDILKRVRIEFDGEGPIIWINDEFLYISHCPFCGIDIIENQLEWVKE